MQETLKLLRKYPKKELQIGTITKIDNGADEDEYVVELRKGLRIERYPVIFQHEVQKGNYRIEGKIPKMFIRGRVVPRNRMGLGGVLKSIGLKSYNEWEIIKKTNGQASDTIRIVK